MLVNGFISRSYITLHSGVNTLLRLTELYVTLNVVIMAVADESFERLFGRRSKGRAPIIVLN